MRAEDEAAQYSTTLKNRANAARARASALGLDYGINDEDGSGDDEGLEGRLSLLDRHRAARAVHRGPPQQLELARGAYKTRRQIDKSRKDETGKEKQGVGIRYVGFGGGIGRDRQGRGDAARLFAEKRSVARLSEPEQRARIKCLGLLETLPMQERLRLYRRVHAARKTIANRVEELTGTRALSVGAVARPRTLWEMDEAGQRILREVVDAERREEALAAAVERKLEGGMARLGVSIPHPTDRKGNSYVSTSSAHSSSAKVETKATVTVIGIKCDEGAAKPAFEASASEDQQPQRRRRGRGDARRR